MTMIRILSLLWPILVIAAAADSSAPIPLPLTFSNGKYVLGAQMESTSFGMILSTSTGEFVVAGTDCTNCGGAPAFNISASSSALPLSSGGVQNATVLGSAVSGKVISDACSLVSSNGPPWSYQNQTMIVANSSSFPFSSQVSGIFGLGAKGYSGKLDDTVFGSWLASHPAADNFTFGMALKPPKDSGNAGFLHWTAPDPKAYTGDISWVSTQSQNSSLDPTSDFTITLAEWDFSSSGASLSNTRGAFAVVDPFYAEIRAPLSEAREIFGEVQGAVALNGSDTVEWQLDCSTSMTFSVVVGSLKLKVDQSTLIRKDANGTCYSNLVGWADPGVDAFLLGSTFISNTYLIFAISKSGPNSLGFAALPVPSRLSNGAKAGIAIASVVAFAISVALVWLLVKRRSRLSYEKRISQAVSVSNKSQSTYSTVIPMSPTTANQGTELEFSTPISSAMPSPNPSSNPERVTMSVERTAESFALSPSFNTQTSRPSTATHLTGSSPTTDIFTVEPYELPPPPYLAPPPGPSGSREAKRLRPPSTS